MNWCVQVRIAEYMLTMVETDIGEKGEGGDSFLPVTLSLSDLKN